MLGLIYAVSEIIWIKYNNCELAERDIPSLTLLVGHGDPKTLDLKNYDRLMCVGGVWLECLKMVVFA